MKYKISFSGFHYVEADSEDEAEEKAMYEDEAFYSEKHVDMIEEVDDIVVGMGDTEWML